MSEKRQCPHCGAPVYSTDEVCMSCGQSLTQPKPPAAEQPAPAPPTTRQPSTAAPPVTYRIVETFGSFWHIFPWVAVAWGALLGAMRFSGPELFTQLPMFIAIPVLLSSSLVGMALLAWTIIDVLYVGASIVWMLIAIMCYPVGLVAYLLWGRQ